MTSWADRLGVFDLETTGVDVESARIVTACIAVLDADGEVLDRWDWLADPGVEIPEGASEVHGIPTERARAEGRPTEFVVAEITQTLRTLFGLGIPVVVYNAPYDLSLLDRECRRNELDPLVDPSPVIDPLVLDKAVDSLPQGQAHARGGRRTLRRDPRRRPRRGGRRDRRGSGGAGAARHLSRRARHRDRRPARASGCLVRRAGGPLPGLHPPAEGRRRLHRIHRLAGEVPGASRCVPRHPAHPAARAASGTRPGDRLQPPARTAARSPARRSPFDRCGAARPSRGLPGRRARDAPPAAGRAARRR